MYDSMRQALGALDDGATIVDVPCGGGVALRGLRPDQAVEYIAVDASHEMLARLRRRAERRSLHQVRTIAADIHALPLRDGVADLCLCYSGLHAVANPRAALREVVRCTKPGAGLVGTTFVAEGTRRQRLIFETGRRRGLPAPAFTARDLLRWLVEDGIDGAAVEPDRGFVLFRGRRSHTAARAL